MDVCQRPQEQFQIDPCRRRVDGALETIVTRTRSDLSIEARNLWWFAYVGGLGSARFCNQFGPVGRFQM